MPPRPDARGVIYARGMVDVVADPSELANVTKRILVSVLEIPLIVRIRARTFDSSSVDAAWTSASRSQRPFVSCRARTAGSPSSALTTSLVFSPSTATLIHAFNSVGVESGRSLTVYPTMTPACVKRAMRFATVPRETASAFARAAVLVRASARSNARSRRSTKSNSARLILSSPVFPCLRSVAGARACVKASYDKDT